MQFNTAHGGKFLPLSMPPGPRRRLARCSYRLRQIGPRPLTRFDTRREWTEIDDGNATEGLATVRAAMRDDVVARGCGFPHTAVPSPKELDRGIDVIAANGARAPDSHDRCLLFRRMIREPCGMRPWPPRSHHIIRRSCTPPFRMAHSGQSDGSEATSAQMNGA